MPQGDLHRAYRPPEPRVPVSEVRGLRFCCTTSSAPKVFGAELFYRGRYAPQRTIDNPLNPLCAPCGGTSARAARQTAIPVCTRLLSRVIKGTSGARLNREFPTAKSEDQPRFMTNVLRKNPNRIYLVRIVNRIFLSKNPETHDPARIRKFPFRPPKTAPLAAKPNYDTETASPAINN